MAGVHCEICGGNLVAAERSTMFICEHCGIKYPKDKVRRMLFKDSGIESNAPATEEEINRFHRLLKKYFDEENFVDAEKMTNRILEVDPEDKMANDYFDVLCQMKKDFRVERGILVKYTGKAADVHVPRLVTAIGDKAFQNCETVVSITLPQGVRSLGNYAFSGCTHLKSIELPRGVTFIGYRAFARCTSLESLQLPDTVKFIGNYAFYDCRNLKALDLPPRVPTIGRGTFSHCQKLSAMRFPKRVKNIGDYAFQDCISLKTVGPFDEIMAIGEGAFDHCPSLEEIKIPHRFMDNATAPYSSASLKTLRL